MCLPRILMLRMNGTCHIWMSHRRTRVSLAHSHVTCEWVMSRMNESCYIWMGHVTYEWVFDVYTSMCLLRIRMSWHTCECARHIWMRRVAYVWVMSLDFYTPSHVTYERVMSHMSHVTWLIHSHVTYEWVVLHMNESRHSSCVLTDILMSMSHIYENVFSCQCHIRMSHVIHEPCHLTYIFIFMSHMNDLEWRHI